MKDIMKLIREKAEKLEETNYILDTYAKNKQQLIKLADPDIINLLALLMFFGFADQCLNLINNWLRDNNEIADESIKNWLKEDYIPFIRRSIDKLKITTYKELVNFSILLDNQKYFLKNALDNGEGEAMLRIFSISFELERKWHIV